MGSSAGRDEQERVTYLRAFSRDAAGGRGGRATFDSRFSTLFGGWPGALREFGGDARTPREREARVRSEAQGPPRTLPVREIILRACGGAGRSRLMLAICDRERFKPTASRRGRAPDAVNGRANGTGRASRNNLNEDALYRPRSHHGGRAYLRAGEDVSGLPESVAASSGGRHVARGSRVGQRQRRLPADVASPNPGHAQKCRNYPPHTALLRS